MFCSSLAPGVQALGPILGLILALLGTTASAQKPYDGSLHTKKGPRFPIGFYEMPRRDDDLKQMAAAGINLVRCGGKADLDRCKEAGLFGWISLPVDAGPTDLFKKRVLELRDHSALAVWEGPDEIVWNFTTYSGLAQTANITRDDWTHQRPNAVAYARKEAAKIMPRMREAIKFVRDNDPQQRPFWINEAGGSDPIYVRQYISSIDVTGCDVYPVKPEGSNMPAVGKMTDLWRRIGRDKPVWMVLQACSWHRVRPARYKEPAHPTFDQTRFMAWDVIVHGARGMLYWGSQFVDDGRFIPSLYAMAAELRTLDPFLVGLDSETFAPPGCPSSKRLEVQLLADLDEKVIQGVRAEIRLARGEGDGLIVLVNEDADPHPGVEVSGLDAWEGRDFFLLYGDETVNIKDGEMMTRMQPYEVKLFATSRKWESRRTSGRDYR